MQQRSIQDPTAGLGFRHHAFPREGRYDTGATRVLSGAAAESARAWEYPIDARLRGKRSLGSDLLRAGLEHIHRCKLRRKARRQQCGERRSQVVGVPEDDHSPQRCFATSGPQLAAARWPRSSSDSDGMCSLIDGREFRAHSVPSDTARVSLRRSSRGRRPDGSMMPWRGTAERRIADMGVSESASVGMPCLARSRPRLFCRPRLH